MWPFTCAMLSPDPEIPPHLSQDDSANDHAVSVIYPDPARSPTLNPRPLLDSDILPSAMCVPVNVFLSTDTDLNLEI